MATYANSLLNTCKQNILLEFFLIFLFELGCAIIRFHA